MYILILNSIFTQAPATARHYADVGDTERKCVPLTLLELTFPTVDK